VIVQSVVERVQTGPIKNVVEYGTARIPASPYVVIKPEATWRGTMLRVITHMDPDQQKWLRNYVLNTLSDLLSGYEGDTDEGVHFKVEMTQEWTDTTDGNDDGTISMERLFLLPGLLF